MLKFGIFCAVLLGLIANTFCTFRIVNGSPGKIEDFPYLVSLQHRGIVRCGGTIYNERVIITAAHCLQEGVILQKLSVRAGTEYGERHGVQIPVKNFVNHPKYVRLTQNNDIALVFLQQPLDLKNNPAIKSIKLPTPGAEPPYGKVGVVAGWGRLGEKEGFPDVFHFVKLPVLKRDSCIKTNGNKSGYDAFRVTENMFCAGYLEGGKDSCKSDSGGPFVVDDILVGVVSFGQGCARPKFPGVYTKVSQYIQWIEETVKEHLL